MSTWQGDLPLPQPSNFKIKDMKLDFSDDIEFYGDKTDPSVIYAEFIVPSDSDSSPDKEYFVRIDSSIFESYLRVFVVPQMEEKTSVTKLLVDIRDYFNLHPCEDEVAPKMRAAGYLQDGLIEYDLCNKQQEYVEVTANGWKITKSHQHKFVKSSKHLPQVCPKESNKSLLKLLKPYVNVSKRQFVLFVTWLVQAFCQGSHHCLIISASKGCGKTTLSRNIRKLLDNSKDTAVIMSSSQDHLLTTLTNSYVVAFDNCSDELFDKSQSNILCCAVTGATYVKREYYSTNKQASFDLQNILLINGINFSPPEADLADRCLMLNLKPLEDKRKADREIEDSLNHDLPEIMGAIFSTISDAMKIFPSIKPSKLPRMLEPYVDMLSIAMALGISQELFEDIYFENLADIDRARADIAIIQAIREFMNSAHVQGRKIGGTMTEIYKKILSNYSGLKSDLPRSASHFSRKLTEEHNALYQAGYVINIDDTYDDGTHVTIIKK